MILAHGHANSRHCFVELLPRRMSGVVNGAFVLAGSLDHTFDLYALESAVPEIIGTESLWCLHAIVLVQTIGERNIYKPIDIACELAPKGRFWLRAPLEVAPNVRIEVHASAKK
jgi:hypothetical protein